MTHTIEQGITHEAPSTASDPQQPPRRSRRTVLGWAAIAVGLVGRGAGAADDHLGPVPAEDHRPHAERELGRPPAALGGRGRALLRRPAELPPGRCPRIGGRRRALLADQQSSRPVGVPGSADGAERYLADQQSSRPVGVPGSADGAERYLADHR